MALPELTKTYAVEDVLVIVNGIPISGMAEGVKVKRSTDAFTKKIGVDGTGARAKSPDKSGEIEITLLGTSKSNDYLNGIAALDEITGLGVASAMIKDLRGSTNLLAECWVKKLPDLDLGLEVPAKRWLLDATSITGAIGGNF